MPGEIDPRWTQSDLYHNSFLLKPDDALEHALSSSEENGLPKIAVSAAQGKLLYLVAKSISAKRVLEVGTLGGCGIPRSYRCASIHSMLFPQVLDHLVCTRLARGRRYRHSRNRFETCQRAFRMTYMLRV